MTQYIEKENARFNPEHIPAYAFLVTTLNILLQNLPSVASQLFWRLNSKNSPERRGIALTFRNRASYI
jgi:hypothetical protein